MQTREHESIDMSDIRGVFVLLIFIGIGALATYIRFEHFFKRKPDRQISQRWLKTIKQIQDKLDEPVAELNPEPIKKSVTALSRQKTLTSTSDEPTLKTDTDSPRTREKKTVQRPRVKGKTALVRDRLEEKQIQKRIEKEEAAKKQETERKEKQKKPSPPLLKKETSTSPVLVPATRSTVPVLPQPARPEEMTAKKLKKHAFKLLEIDFSDPQLSLIDKQAFIYHFHRYNLARALLYFRDEAQFEEAVQLRTFAVHCFEEILPLLTNELLIETQNKLKAFIVSEVAELTQKYTYEYVKSDRAQQALLALAGRSSLHQITFDSIQTTPLYEIFTHLFNEHANPRQAMSDNELFTKTIEQLIPSFVALYEQMHLLPQASLQQARHIDALKFTIVMMGELYQDRAKDFGKSSISLDNTVISAMKNFIFFCRKWRNQIAHGMSEIKLMELENLYKKAKKVMRVFPGISISSTNRLLGDRPLASEPTPSPSEASPKRPAKSCHE